MGMFDSVYAKCLKCSGRVELQSKGGPCELNEYPDSDIPEDVALDLDWRPICDSCGWEFAADLTRALTSDDRLLWSVALRPLRSPEQLWANESIRFMLTAPVFDRFRGGPAWKFMGRKDDA